MYKMNEIVNKFLLAGDKFMPEIYLKQPRFTYIACGPFTKNKERIQQFKETRDTNYIYKNELDKAYFQHDMAYGDFKDLAKRTTSDKVLKYKAFNVAKNPKYDGYQRGLASMLYKFLFNVAKNPKYDGYQRGLASMLYKFFDKKSSSSGIANNKIKQNMQLAEELHKPIIGNFKKRTVYSGFRDNI